VIVSDMVPAALAGAPTNSLGDHLHQFQSDLDQILVSIVHTGLSFR